MAIVATDNKHYYNIAEAIREKTQIYTPYTPAEMPTGINEVYNAGKSSGFEDGWASGLEQGHEHGYEHGKQAEYDRFWDIFQQQGKRNAYNYAFCGAGWTSETFMPKYNMKPYRSDAMFHTSAISGDLVKILENCGVSIDFSTCSTVAQTYLYTQFTRVGIHDTRAATSLSMMFYFNSYLTTIDKLILKDDGSQAWQSTFHQCKALENIVIEGKIGQNGFDVQHSTNLTYDSLMSIINALVDYAADTSGTTWAVTLGSVNLAKLTDAEKAIATQKGWTLA